MRRSGPVKIYAQNCSQAPAECKRQTSLRIKVSVKPPRV